MKILLIEDEKKMASYIKRSLEEHGHSVDLSYDGYTGKRLAMVNSYDIMILDVIIPKINGVDLCKELRASNIKTPILMLTALGTIDDKVMGFEAGADDYLVKPFEFQELLLRINSWYKRTQEISRTGVHLRIADLEMNLHEKSVKRNKKAIDLTAKEFGLLEYFMKNKGKIISREEIAENVWDTNFESATNVIDVYVNFLRKKIDKEFEAKLIHTVFGMGYILKEELNEDKK
jgi:two-component system copper resistance phosphate regulon response regulator CusR